ncbi:MAG: hypothetical protein LEGION0403_FIIPPAGN_00885 [Legionella sp.]|uniref:ATP dependent DNA ligase n=1 Tax=Legionella sp. TaxID=459 RepID=UPI003D122FD7
MEFRCASRPLGLYNKQGDLDFISNVGTGFTEASEKEIYQQLKQNELSTNPFSSAPLALPMHIG